jgi:YebC/PmpR family DNA-binding regulatory protein
MSGHSKWANIKHKKGRMDAIRGKITTKIAREITVAVRMGGADPTGNMRLKLALGKARENNVPKDNIQRAIQKGQGNLEGSNYEELTYEGYGPGGVALIVEVMTDNRNRTAADLRHLFSKNGGNMGESGCVSWMFKRKGLFTLEKEESFDEDELMMTVLEAGADDMSVEEEEVEVLTSPEAFAAVQEKLEAEKVKILSAQLGLFPDTRIAVEGDDATKLIKLLDALEDHDDVQEVYGNFDLPEDAI